jgi:hypothetical protein
MATSVQSDDPTLFCRGVALKGHTPCMGGLTTKSSANHGWSPVRKGADATTRVGTSKRQEEGGPVRCWIVLALLLCRWTFGAVPLTHAQRIYTRDGLGLFAGSEDFGVHLSAFTSGLLRAGLRF